MIKKVDRVIALVAICGITLLIPASALAEYDNEPLSEHDQLKAAIAIIESVDINDMQEFCNSNQEWLLDINTRLDVYLEAIPASQREAALIELRGENPRLRYVFDYFDSFTYGMRNGFLTYSLLPKMSTRLLWAYAEAGWVDLTSIYTGIGNDNGSLYNQYMCHFDLFVEADWDIEIGRPLVSYAATLLALCNPGTTGYD
jgi:hypothetical protein